MEQKFVDIGDMKIASLPNTLVTLALGSCIGIAAYDSLSKIGAILHLMLPEAKVNPKNAEQKPFVYADSGIDKMIDSLVRAGAKKNRLMVKIAGGANIMDPNGMFDIGKRNFLAAKRQLWKHNILVKSSSVGGGRGRSLKLDLNDGSVYVKYNSETTYFKI